MAHLVETMAYAGTTPWHGLGTQVNPDISIEEMLLAAKLGWGVNKCPVQALIPQADGTMLTKLVQDQYALTRDSDNSVLGIVGEDYKPLQNKDAFEFFRDFLQAGDMQLETAGSLKEGRSVWGLCKLKNDIVVNTKKGSDITQPYLLLSTGHDGKQSLIIKLTSVRVVCNNTLTLSLNMKENMPVFRMTHRTEFTQGMQDYAKAFITSAATGAAEYQRQAQILVDAQLPFVDAIPLLASVYQPSVNFKDETAAKEFILKFDEMANSTMKKIREDYFLQTGRIGETAFDILNAVTFMNTHQQGRTQDNRLSNSWFGPSATKNTQVLNGLLAMVSSKAA